MEGNGARAGFVRSQHYVNHKGECSYPEGSCMEMQQNRLRGRRGEGAPILFFPLTSVESIMLHTRLEQWGCEDSFAMEMADRIAERLHDHGMDPREDDGTVKVRTGGNAK